MSKVFIIHGSYGNPEENWFPWLKKRLEESGYEVFVPKFPTPENQTLENWLEVFGSFKDQIDENTIFVGHSLGPVFILAILEQLSKTVKACFFVAGFLELLGDDLFDDINKTFVVKEFDWVKIKENCDQFFVYHGNDDPYVPLDYSYKFSDKLGVKTVVIENGGHFNESSGYIKFEKLFDDIKKIK